MNQVHLNDEFMANIDRAFCLDDQCKVEIGQVERNGVFFHSIDAYDHTSNKCLDFTHLEQMVEAPLFPEHVNSYIPEESYPQIVHNHPYDFTNTTLHRRRKSSVLTEDEGPIHYISPKKLRSDTSFCSTSSSEEDGVRSRRGRWTQPDVLALWKAIEKHGNQWKAVSRELNRRSYHQVKDKGRRMLRAQDWETGKSKKTSRMAQDVAKQIATSVLMSRTNERDVFLIR